MPGAQGFVEVGTLGQRKNTGGIGNAIPLQNDAAVMDGVVGEKNRLQHLRRGIAVNFDAGFHRFMQLDGLFDGNEGANPDIGEAFDGLNDHFDGFALFAGGGKEREVAELGQHAAEFWLKNHHGAEHDEHGGAAEQPAQHLEVQDGGGQHEGQQEDKKADDHGPAACAAHKAQGKIDQHREDENFHRGPPSMLKVKHHWFLPELLPSFALPARFPRRRARE